jgi:hypothetical protein
MVETPILDGDRLVDRKDVRFVLSLAGEILLPVGVAHFAVSLHYDSRLGAVDPREPRAERADVAAAVGLRVA